MILSELITRLIEIEHIYKPEIEVLGGAYSIVLYDAESGYSFDPEGEKEKWKALTDKYAPDSDYRKLVMSSETPDGIPAYAWGSPTNLKEFLDAEHTACLHMLNCIKRAKPAIKFLKD